QARSALNVLNEEKSRLDERLKAALDELSESQRTAATLREELKRRPSSAPPGKNLDDALPATNFISPVPEGPFYLEQEPAPIGSPEALADRLPEPVPGTFPTLQDLLDPAWARIISVIRPPLANALAHMRRLGGLRLPNGALTFLRLAASEIARAQDHLKAWAQFLEETTPPPAPGRVERAVERALASWEPVFRARRISLQRKGPADLPPAIFHAETLRVAMFQILRNAYEAMPRGGTLTVQMAQDPESGQLRATFSDTGPGFPEHMLSDIFMPFASGKPGRLGVGLALVRKTLRAIGGEAEAGNGQKGAFVTLIFPLPGDPPPDAAEEA
ncbi:MAG: sensor histidine kinase, partial [Methanothrix sp.]|nr:sensor histidine kinase [Methanothrix sp.]